MRSSAGRARAALRRAGSTPRRCAARCRPRPGRWRPARPGGSRRPRSRATRNSRAARLLGRLGAKPALVADRGHVLGLLQPVAQRVEHLDPGAQRLGEAVEAQRHRHELLDVQRVVGVGAAVDEVHARHRQHPWRRCRRGSGRAAGRTARRPRGRRPGTPRGWRWRPSRLLSSVPSSSIRRPVDRPPGRARPCPRRCVGDLAVDVARPP